MKVGCDLGGGTLTYSTDMSLLVGNHKVAPLVGWGKASSHIEAWVMFCTVFLGEEGVHSATYEMFLLLEETSGVSPRLQVQACQQPTFLDAVICLIQKYFNERFQQVL